MKLVYQYMAVFINFSPTSNHLHALQVENCDSNSQLVVDEDDNSKFRLERVNHSVSIHRRHCSGFRAGYQQHNEQSILDTLCVSLSGMA